MNYSSIIFSNRCLSIPGRGSAMSAVDELIRYIKTLAPEDAKKAKTIALAWLSRRREEAQHPPRTNL